MWSFFTVGDWSGVYCKTSSFIDLLQNKKIYTKTQWNIPYCTKTQINVHIIRWLMIPERHLGAEDVCEISQALQKIDVQGFVTCLLFICMNKQTDNYHKFSAKIHSWCIYYHQRVKVRGSTMIKLNIFPPFLADMYASSTFSLMEGHFKVAFAFVRGDMQDGKIKGETDHTCVRCQTRM